MLAPCPLVASSACLARRVLSPARPRAPRWSVCAFLCCLVLLVVLCYLLGLLLGPLGLKESALPTQRSCLSNTGGDFFMA